MCLRFYVHMKGSVATVSKLKDLGCRLAGETKQRSDALANRTPICKTWSGDDPKPWGSGRLMLTG